MTDFYLESSGLLKRYKAEVGSSLVDAIFAGKRPDEEFVTSQLTLLETTAVASRMVKGRLLTAAQYEVLVGSLYADLSDFAITVLPLTQQIAVQAFELYPESGLRAADALHLALALDISRALGSQRLCVVSADKEIREACQYYGLRVLDPESPTGATDLLSMR